MDWAIKGYTDAVSRNGHGGRILFRQLSEALGRERLRHVLCGYVGRV